MAYRSSLLLFPKPAQRVAVDPHQDRFFAMFIRHAMKALFIPNDPPYGTEGVYNALRLAQSLIERGASVQSQFFSWLTRCWLRKLNKKTPDGYYNIERMLRRIVSHRSSVLLCGTCMDVRGVSASELMDGVRRSTMDELAAATMHADKVLVF